LHQPLITLGESVSFEAIFQPLQEEILGGTWNLGYIVATRVGGVRGYFLIQGEPAPSEGTVLTSTTGDGHRPDNTNRILEPVTAGHWYYVAGSYSADIVNGTVTFTNYVADLTAGETVLTAVGPFTNSGGTYPIGDTTLGIGKRWDSGESFPGLIDEVNLYQAELGPAEFQAHLDALTGGAPTFEITGIDYSPADDTVALSWESQAGMVYNLLSSPDVTGDSSTWTLVVGDIPASPDINTQTLARPGDAALFYQLEQFRKPPLTVLSEDFDGSPDLPDGWTTGVNAGDTGTTKWEVGNPAGGPGPSASNSGANSIGTNLAANYGISSDRWLRSPGTIDLTTAISAKLAFHQWVDMDNFDQGDTGTVRILDAAGLPGNVTELAVIRTNIQGLAPAGWVKFSKNLPDTVLGKMVVLEFRFASDFVPDGDASGWYIDDVVITAEKP
jgi:hypothetical protein